MTRPSIHTLFAMLFATMLSAPLYAADAHIDHLEPPFWWSGMQNRQLQLMVHGEQIAELEPTLNYPGVRIASVQRVANRNYLFIDLVIDAKAAPGAFDIVFQRGARSVSYNYRLLAREPGSAARIGFNSSDAILNLMPDRFANGNPANDSVAGLAEKADRNNGGGRHGGDIQGIVDHLDYIAAMGYTQIWPTPLVENNSPAYSYHGYAVTDSYRVDARFGSNDDYKRLVQEARKRGMGVIQDVVLSHIGVQHWWMKDLPTPDWVNHNDHFTPTQHHRVAVQDNYGSQEDRQNFTTGWFGPGMPDMNQTNPFVANYQIQNNIWWIEYAGLSGLRVDTYGYSDTAFLTEWSRRVMAEYPHLNMVGEEWSMLPPVVSHWQAGKQNANGYVSYLPSLMDFPMMDVMRRALAGTGETGLSDVYETLSLDYLYPNPGNLVLFEGNHDVARLFSVVGEDYNLFKMDIAYVLTMPRIPQLYYGTELLMTSETKVRNDASYRRDFPGGWAGDKVNGFTGAGLSAQQAAAQAFVKKLLNWRKGQDVIHHGKMMHFGPEQNTYVYFRYDDRKKIMVVFNRNDKPVSLPTARFHEMLDGVGTGVDVISGQTYSVASELALPARSVLVLELAAPKAR